MRCSLLKQNSTAQVELLTPKTEHESLLARVAASELTNTALQERISQLQDAVEILSVSVLHHRAAFDSLAERQLANVNQDCSGKVRRAVSYAGYLIDNSIPVPVFSWPWTPRRYTTWKSDYDGQRFISIEAFTDDELNYNTGDRILITGVTVTTGPTVGGEEFLLDSTLINGLREVAESVQGLGTLTW